MDSYEILWKRSAEHDLKNIDPQYISRIVGVIESLTENPFPKQARRLLGSERTYRIRIGKYRVIYQVNVDKKEVIIFYVRHRKDAYKK